MNDLFSSKAGRNGGDGYSAKDIEDLEGLEPVRRRPGMYIGGTDETALHHFGALRLSVRAEGGHYTFVQVDTDQIGESRLDRNVKKFFVSLHRADDPQHRLTSSY